MIIKYGLPLIHHVQLTNSEDDNGDFRKRCKRVILENGAEILLTSHPILNIIFTFTPAMVLKMYEDTRWHNVILNLKQFFG